MAFAHRIKCFANLLSTGKFITSQSSCISPSTSVRIEQCYGTRAIIELENESLNFVTGGYFRIFMEITVALASQRVLLLKQKINAMEKHLAERA